MLLQEFLTESLKRKSYEDIVDARMSEIATNFALILYCNKYDANNRIKRHWKDELITHINPIVSHDVKGGDKYNVIDNIIDVSRDIMDKLKVSKIISNKFKDEGLNKYIDDISEEVASNVSILRTILHTNNTVELRTPVDNL